VNAKQSDHEAEENESVLLGEALYRDHHEEELAAEIDLCEAAVSVISGGHLCRHRRRSSVALVKNHAESARS
jgi:hypothetical protein